MGTVNGLPPRRNVNVSASVSHLIVRCAVGRQSGSSRAPTPVLARRSSSIGTVLVECPLCTSHHFHTSIEDERAESFSRSSSRVTESESPPSFWATLRFHERYDSFGRPLDDEPVHHQRIPSQKSIRGRLVRVPVVNERMSDWRSLFGSVDIYGMSLGPLFKAPRVVISFVCPLPSHLNQTPHPTMARVHPSHSKDHATMPSSGPPPLHSAMIVTREALVARQKILDHSPRPLQLASLSTWTVTCIPRLNVLTTQDGSKASAPSHVAGFATLQGGLKVTCPTRPRMPTNGSNRFQGEGPRSRDWVAGCCFRKRQMRFRRGAWMPLASRGA